MDFYGLSNGSLLWNCDGTTSPPSNGCNYEYEGTVFFDTCDGQSYYLIELENGDIIDPYLVNGLQFDFLANDGKRIAFSYDIAPFNSPCTFEALAVNLVCIKVLEDTIPSSFDNYPWLYTIVDQSDCCSTNEVYEYTNGIYSYIYIVPQEECGEPMMYSSSGQFYCQSSSFTDCLGIYGLYDWEINLLYACSGKTAGNQTEIGKETPESFDIVAYPNPSDGYFTIDYRGTNENTILQVFSMNGDLLLEQDATQTTNIDLSGYPSGMYLLQMTDGFKVVSKKLMIK